MPNKGPASVKLTAHIQRPHPFLKMSKIYVTLRIVYVYRYFVTMGWILLIRQPTWGLLFFMTLLMVTWVAWEHIDDEQTRKELR